MLWLASAVLAAQGPTPSVAPRSQPQSAAAVADPAHPVALPDGPGLLTFEGVSFAYSTGRRVLDGLDLELRGGEAVAIVGAVVFGLNWGLAMAGDHAK